MQFKDVVGQDAAKDTLVQLFESGHLPHAMLMLGKEGTGGLPLALAFAQYIFCENKQGNDSCGACSSCIKTSQLAHPDLHLTFPCIAPKPGQKALSRFFMQEFREFAVQNPYGTTFDWLQFINAENKQGNIPAEECRDIIEHLNLKSYEGGRKIQILWRPEYLGKEGNILLKLIEEPPADTLLLLVAENTEEILDTILSRTQLLKLLPVAAEDIAGHLAVKNNLDRTHAMQIAQLAEGSYTQALQALRHHSGDMLPPLRAWIKAVFNNDGIAINHWVDDMSKQGREQQKNVLLYVQQLLAQAFRKTMISEYQPPLTDEGKEFVQMVLSSGLTSKAFQLMNDSIAKAIYHIERNAHSKTQLLHLSLQMQYHLKERVLKAF